MSVNILKALQIMGFGMAGIFAAIIIIMILVWILQRMDNIGKNKEN